MHKQAFLSLPRWAIITVIDKGKTVIDLNNIGDTSAEDWESIIIFEAEGWSDTMKYGSATSNKAEDEVVTWIDRN